MSAATQLMQVVGVNPFPGLRPFEVAESYLFFGREKQTEELVDRLWKTRFVAVVGGSGSGKSSLVRAGLIPALQSGSAWRSAVCRPGDNPLRNLAHALYHQADLGKFGALPALRDVQLDILETSLRSSSAGLSAAVRESHLAEAEKLLIVVDQFEELFRYRAFGKTQGGTQYQETATAFVKLLLNAASDPSLPIYVVVTMRSDFIGSCAPFPGLPRAVSEGQFLVPYLSRQELRRAITGPAEVMETEIAPRLVVRLLNEVGDDPDQLPVLQHALMRSWDYWQEHHEPGELIDLRHYEAIGTMQKALSNHADDAYNELKTPVEQAIAQKAFRALVETDEQGRIIRRPSTVDQISEISGQPVADIKRVLDHFSDPTRAFIVFRTDSFVDLSHESLFRIWGKLKKWAADEAQAANLYRRLATSAKLRAEGAESLWVNPQLALALKWRKENQPTAAWAERYAPNLDVALRFLDDSKRTDRRTTVLGLAMIASLIGLLVVVALLTLRSNRLLERELSSLRQQQRVAAKDVTDLTAQSNKLVAQLKGIQRQSDQLSQEEQTALQSREAALTNLGIAISADGSVASRLVAVEASNRGLMMNLAKANEENQQLLTKFAQLKAALPPSAPQWATGAPAYAMAAPARPKAEKVDRDNSADASVQEILDRTSRLETDADELNQSSQKLSHEVSDLMQQNDRLQEMKADLSVQVAQLQDEIKLLSYVNGIRKQTLADLNSVSAKLRADEASLKLEAQDLASIQNSQNETANTLIVGIQTLTQVNANLSKALATVPGQR